jgi:serine/arginine repetitive matrix protein 2
MAMTSDAQIIPETDAHMISPVPNSQPETVSPTPRLPGYIPGMPRPMTPRDFDSDGQRSHSTTPRATSPNAHPTNSDRLSPGVSNAGVIRRGSDASTTRRSSRPEATSPSSPMFVPRSTNGRFTPEDRVVARMLSTDVDYMSASAILAARRGAPSPTTATTFQPLAVSSRPGTPSNVIWNVSPNSTTQRSPGHGRHGSWASDAQAGVDDLRTAHAANTPPPVLSRTRSVRSPPPVDSPTFDRQQTISPDFGSIEDHQHFTPISRSDFGSPTTITGRLRSPTPTQSVRSPTSPAFSNQGTRTNTNGYSHRSSNHNVTPASSFSLGAGHGFAFSPMPNSSRSSLESAGSSYHSWEGAGQKEPALFTALDPQQLAWHDVSSDTSKSSSWSSDEPSKAEDVIGRYAGLTKVDFVAIQERLVKAAVAKNVTPPLRDRAPSLRRRRPSTSQSNYSLNGYDNRVSVLYLKRI